MSSGPTATDTNLGARQTSKSGSNGAISYADAMSSSTAGAPSTSMVNTQLHASLLPRALSYGSQQSHGSASGSVAKESFAATAAGKQRTTNALAAVNNKIDKQSSPTPAPPADNTTSQPTAPQQNQQTSSTNGVDSTTDSNKATDNTASSQPPSTTASSVSTVDQPAPGALSTETSPRNRAGARQSGNKPKNNRKSYDSHSNNNSPRQQYTPQMFDYNLQRHASNPSVQPQYYRQPSGGRGMPTYMQAQPYMQYAGMQPMPGPQYYMPQPQGQPMTADMMQLHQQMAALGRQTSNTQTVPSATATTSTNSPRSAQHRSIPSTASPMTPQQTQRQTSNSASPLLPTSAPGSVPLIAGGAMQLPQQQPMQIPPGYYYDPRYQAFVAGPQMPYNVSPQYYQQAMHAQQQMRYPQPVPYQPQAQPYANNSAYPQQQPQPLVVALAKFPTQNTVFPPTTVSTMPSFTTLVIPNPGQLPSSAPERQQLYFSIDVECVATGTGHNDRSVGSIAVVDMHEQVVLNVVVKPDLPVVSCLTALTGLQQHQITNGVTLQQALQLVKNVITRDSIIVGQNVLKDINWLGLVEGQDYASLIDLAGCYRVKNPQYNNWSAFSLSHIAKSLLGLIQSEPHHAVDDAYLSVKLYALYKRLHAPGNEDQLNKANELLLSTPMDSSFSKRFPEVDGVCLGNKKACKCGQAFLF